MVKPVLKVLVMWQGTAGEDAVRAVREEFRDHWDSERKRGRPPDFDLDFCDVSRCRDGLKDDVLSRTLALIKTCDCALALHTADERAASDRAGNLWFELGLWYALRDPDQVFLASVSGPPASATVALPSDLGAKFVRRAGAQSDLLADAWNAIETFLARQCAEQSQARAAGSYRSSDKVRDTLGLKTSRWLDGAVGQCGRDHGEHCGCAADSLTFVAELLRIEETTSELAQVSGLLYQVSMEAAELSWSPEARPSKRRDALAGLRTALTKLTAFEKAIQRARVAQDESDQGPGPHAAQTRQPHASRFGAWGRLQHFFAWRAERFVPPALDEARLQQAIEDFPAAASVFTDKAISQDPYFQSEKAATHVPALADSLADYARTLARYGDNLRETWLAKTNSALADMVQETPRRVDPFNPSYTIAEAVLTLMSELGRSSQRLPHNVLDDWKVPIWPTPRRSDKETRQ